MLFFLNIAYSQNHNLANRLINFAKKSHLLLLANMLVLLNFASSTVHAVQQTEETTAILFTELFYDTPAQDSEQEWVELANFGSSPVDLSDYKMGDEEESRGKEGMLRFPKQSVLLPGQVIVIAQSARGFYALYGRYPDFEINDSDPQVPDMRRYILWAVGDFALANDGDELLLLNDQNQLVDTVNYGDKRTYFDPAISTVYTGQSIERVPASCDTDSAADWQPSRFPAPGALNLEGECTLPEAPLSPVSDLLSIGQIQGAGDISPFVNQRVEFRGVVIGTLEDRNSAGIIFNTLFVQDVPGLEDGDPATSDGIAVFLGRYSSSAQPGDLLHITGQVTEFFGLTEIDDHDLQFNIESREHSLPEAMLLDLSQESLGTRQYLESHESMMVTTVDSAQVVGPTHPGCGFALIDSLSTQRPNPRQKTEDEIQQPMLVLYNSDVDCRELPEVKTGDFVSAVSGPLTYHFDQYKIILQNNTPLQITAAPWPILPNPFQRLPDQFTIATFNFNNHFDGEKNMPSSAEPLVSAADLQTKQKKLADALGNTLGCPTIVAIQEVENELLLQSLVKETAEICGFTYEISHRDSSDSRGLDLALLTDPRLVDIISIAQHQTCTAIDTGVIDPDITCHSGESPLFGRPPLQVDLRVADAAYTVYVNHFKSKREGEEETAVRRLQQSHYTTHLVEGQLAEDPQAKIVVIGDFNDFELSPTMLQLTENGNLENVLQRLPLEDRYTYIFDGVPQLIDGILVSTAVLPYVSDVLIIHANADYPVGFADDITGHELALHVTDHDLPLLLLDLPAAVIPASPSPRPAPTHTPEPSPTAPRMQQSEPVQPSVDPPVIWLSVFLIILGFVFLLLILRRSK